MPPTRIYEHMQSDGTVSRLLGAQRTHAVAQIHAYELVSGSKVDLSMAEHKKTHELMRIYGCRMVRGGPYCCSSFGETLQHQELTHHYSATDRDYTSGQPL
jgi:hypothetical protein